MKNIFYCFAFLIGQTGFTQKAKPYDMVIGGVKVIVVPSGNEIVQMDVVIKGGVQNYPEEKSGIEKLALTALTECGTQKDSKNEFKNRLDEVDAKMFGFTGRDAAHFELNCIRGDFESVWPLYVDALTSPKFDAKEFVRIKTQAINNLREAESNPDAAIEKLAMKTAFKGMDYAKSPDGSIENIQRFTPAQTKAYFQSIFTRARIFIVVVGDISREDLTSKMTALIRKIPAGRPFELKRGTFLPKANSFVSQKKELATNYIMGFSSAPAANTNAYYSAILASGMFYDKMFLEVRTNNGLSYAPAAFITSGLTPYSAMSVTTKEPDKYIAVARQLVDKIKKQGFSAEEVQNKKNTYTTYQFYANEENASLCSMVANNELTKADWRKAFTLKEDLKPVTATDINCVFNKYVGNFTWVYQGNTKRVNPIFFTQLKAPEVQKDKKAF